MANGIRTDDPRGFNKGRSSKFREGSRVRRTPEEGWRTYRPKRSGNNNKDENNSPKTLNDKNQQASSQKFRQLQPTEIEHLKIFKSFLFYLITHTPWQLTIFTNPSTRAGYDTRSIFKLSLTGLNSEFSFS